MRRTVRGARGGVERGARGVPPVERRKEGIGVHWNNSDLVRRMQESGWNGEKGKDVHRLMGTYIVT